MRRLLRTLPLLALLSPGALSGQSIRGMVVEDGTGEPIVGATIQLLALDSTVRGVVTSGRNGWFVLSTKHAGSFLLRPTHPSYAGDAREVEVRGREAVTVMLRMGRVAIPLEPLQVTARSSDRARPFYERARHGGQGLYITRDQIDARVANRPSDLLRTVPAIQFDQAWDGALSRRALRMRSLGDVCNPPVFIDGLLMPRDSAFDVDELITTEQIEGIEIYRNYVSAPLELQMQQRVHIGPESSLDDLTCGLIAFWTRGARGGALTWKRVGLAMAVLAGMVAVTR